MTQYPEAWLCRELGMAVVNISLITDYDAGVHEGTEAVDATDGPRGLRRERRADPEGRPRPDRPVPGRPRRARRARGARTRPAATATRSRPRTSACSRPGCERGRWPVRWRRPADRRHAPDDPGRARLVARERPAARRGRLRGRLGVGPLHGPGRPDRPGRRGLDDPVDGRAARRRGSRSAPFVLNVMNRHPAVLARMASTLQIASGGRLILGIGIGGAPKEHAAYGIEFPEAPERVARLEEAVAVIRALWTGGPVTRPSPFYPLAEAHAHPVPSPPPPDRHRRRDARRGAAGRPDRRRLEHVRRQLRGQPAALPRGARGGRPAARGPARLRRVPGRLARRRDARRTRPGSTAPRETWERWREAGADGAIVLARTTADVDALVEATGRW